VKPVYDRQHLAGSRVQPVDRHADFFSKPSATYLSDEPSTQAAICLLSLVIARQNAAQMQRLVSNGCGLSPKSDEAAIEQQLTLPIGQASSMPVYNHHMQ